MKMMIALLLLATAAPASDAIELLRQALNRLDQLDKDGAEAFLTAALKEEPKLLPAILARGRLREKMGRKAGAARDFERASRLGEKEWRHAAQLYQEASEYEHAAEAYSHAWQQSGKLDSLMRMADARASAGDMKGALLAYNEILTRVKGNATVQYLAERGRIKSALGMYKEGLADLDLALRRIPRYPRAYQLRGRIKIRQGHIQEGVADHERARDQLASHPSSYFILGLAYYDVGRFTDAAEVLERSVGFANAVHPYAHLYLFLARCRTGVPALQKKAAPELLKFLEGRESDDDWYAKVGGFLTGSLEEAELMAAATEGNKHERREHMCEAHAYMGARLMIAGDEKAARAHFKKVLATNVHSYVEYNTAHAELARASR